MPKKKKKLLILGLVLLIAGFGLLWAYNKYGSCFTGTGIFSGAGCGEG